MVILLFILHTVKEQDLKMIIRQLVTEDYDALVALWREAALSHRPNGRDCLERIAHEVAGTTAIFLVAESKERIIGAILGTHDGRKGWINRLAVVPSHQQQGVGTALVAAVEKQLSELGIEIVACLIEEWNKDSAVFFGKLGYHCHSDIHYYSKRKDAAV